MTLACPKLYDYGYNWLSFLLSNSFGKCQKKSLASEGFRGGKIGAIESELGSRLIEAATPERHLLFY